MTPLHEEDSQPAPSAELGWARVAALNLVLLDRQPTVAVPSELMIWAADLAQRGGAARGLRSDTVPEEYLALVQRCGVPLSTTGSLRWGEHCRVDARIDAPRFESASGLLSLPSTEALATCSAIALRPIRAWVQAHLAVRLQAAPAIVCFLWPRRAALISVAEQRLAGFLHGPGAGQRHSLAWQPGQALVLHLADAGASR